MNAPSSGSAPPMSSMDYLGIRIASTGRVLAEMRAVATTPSESGGEGVAGECLS